MSSAMPGIVSIIGKLVDGLRVVGHRAVAIHRDGHRPHAQEAEGHQAEGEDRFDRQRRRHHQGVQAHAAHEVARCSSETAWQSPASRR